MMRRCPIFPLSPSTLALQISYIHTWLVCYITLFFISLCAVWVLDGVGGWYGTGLRFDLRLTHFIYSHVARMLHHVVFHFIVRCVGFGWGRGVVWFDSHVRSLT